MVHPPVTATISEYFNERRAFANGIAFSGASTGGLVFAPIMSALFENYGYTGTLLIVAGMTLNICVTGVLLRPIQWFERTRKKSTSCKNKHSGNEIGEPEREVLVSNGSLFSCDKQKRETNKFTHLVLHSSNEKNGVVVRSTVERIKTIEEPKLMRSGSHDPNNHFDAKHFASSPLLPRARSSSVGNRRPRTISTVSQTSSQHTVSPMHSLVESLSRSKVALYASTDCVGASIVDIQEIPPEERKNIKEPSKVSVWSKLKSSFDLSLFRNPVFCIIFCMCGLFASTCSLIPAFLVPHQKDVGISVQQRGIILSVIAGSGLTSRILCALFADRKFVQLTTLLMIAGMVMGLLAHTLRFFSGFWSFVVMAVCTGK